MVEIDWEESLRPLVALDFRLRTSSVRVPGGVIRDFPFAKNLLAAPFCVNSINLLTLDIQHHCQEAV
jgi:hypothetical protein